MSVQTQIAMIRRQYHIWRNERTQKRNSDRKALNFAQKEERASLSKRHREEDRELQERYESDYRELGAREADELEGVQR